MNSIEEMEKLVIIASLTSEDAFLVSYQSGSDVPTKIYELLENSGYKKIDSEEKESHTVETWKK